VLPPPGDFIAPSQPTLIGSVQGINVVWDGLNSVGDLWPSDTSYVEVHMDTSGPTFTLGTATLKGRLARPGGLAVTGLSRGSTYYFRLRGADAAGNLTDPSTAASGQPGQIDAPDIAANAITANSIVAGTITGWSINSAYLSGGTISGGFITGGTISGGLVTGGTLTGATITSSSVDGYLTPGDVGAGGTTTISGDRITTGTVAAARIDVDNLTVKKLTSGSFSERRVQIGAVGETDAVSFKGASTSNGWFLAHNSGNNNLSLTSDYGTVKLEIGEGLYVQGDTELFGALASPSTSIPNVRINTSTGEIRHTTHANSAQRFKHEVIPLDDSEFGGDISPDVLGNPDQQIVDPFDLLAITPIQYRRNEAPDVVVTGFLAEDVEQKFPTAATYDDDGVLETADERALVAALLAVVKNQQLTIQDLRSRIEALEA